MKRLLFLLLLPSCVSVDYDVAAERATFQQVAPRFTGYIIGDETLTQAQLAQLMLVVDQWRSRIEAAERR